MDNPFIRDGLLATLTECYEADPNYFVSLPKQVLDSSLARETIADLRNEGYIDEQVRGVIRFTRRGYKLYKKRGNSASQESRVQFAV